MSEIPGLSSYGEFVSPEEEQALIAAVDAGPWLTSLRRRVQHYGYRYDYKARTVSRDMYLGDLPSWAGALVARLCTLGAFAGSPDQLIVNEYLPGQGIAPHIDCVPCFGPTIASLGLGSSCLMEFSRPTTGGAASLFFAPRTLLVLGDEARYHWRHAIRARRSDRWEGIVHPRARRISLTFRTVRLDRSVKTGER
jgi:alkylated DNA repair dioxygenase AlkB